MKIAIVSMPRSASKMVLRNFAEYSTVRYGEISLLHIPKLNVVKFSLDEILNPRFEELFTGKVILLPSGDLYVTDIPVIDIQQELKSRIELITQIEKNIVLKYLPNIKYLSDTKAILPMMDKTYYLYRKNMFDHALSCCISIMENSWNSDVKQRNVIMKRLSHNLTISEELFREILKEFCYYRDITSIGRQTFEFEDIIRTRDSRDFCDLFQLEHVDFDFSNKEPEYGNYKLKMVSNIQELRNIFDRIMEDDTERPQSLP